MPSLQDNIYGMNMDERQFRLWFYKLFDENYLYNKAAALLFAVAQGDEFQEQVNSWLDEGGARPLGPKYVEALRAELYFLTLHQFEAFFALLIAPFQGMPEWVFLTEYHTWDLDDFINHFINGDISSLTRGRVTEARDFMSLALYTGARPTDDSARATWDNNLDNAIRIIRSVAGMYVRDREAYNSYKHGLRVMTGPGGIAITTVASPDRPAQTLWDAHFKDALLFLEIEKVNQVRVVNLTKLEINPEACFEMLRHMHAMLATIKTTRLASLQGSKVADSPIANFADIDVDYLLRGWTQGTRYSVSI